MGEENPELAPIAHRDPADKAEEHVCDAAELVAGLESTWRMIQDVLERVFPPPAALREDERDLFGELSAQWIIGHVFEHEIRQGGELSLRYPGSY